MSFLTSSCTLSPSMHEQITHVLCAALKGSYFVTFSWKDAWRIP